MAADDDPPTTPSAGKQPLKLDMDELLRADKDKPVANLVVVSSAERSRMRRSETVNRSSESDSSELLASQTDDDLERQIGRLITLPAINLPDNGEKIRVRVERRRKELQRRSEYRNQREVADARTRCRSMGTLMVIKHWSLVILCISDEEYSGPVLLHLDSLGLHSSPSIFKNVKRDVIL